MLGQSDATKTRSYAPAIGPRIGRGWGGSAQTQQLGAVAPKEAPLDVVREPRQGPAEDLEGVTTALWVRIVGREHEQLRAALLDQPLGVLERERGELQLPAHVVGGQHAERAEQGLELGEVLGGVIDVAQERGHPRGAELDGPATQLWVALEHPVQDEAGQESLRRVVHHREVLGPEVLAAAQPVDRPWPAVVVEGTGQ